jgi:hypothetical protein
MIQGSCGFEYCTTRIFTEKGLNPILQFHSKAKSISESAIKPNYSFDQSIKEQEDDNFEPF